MSYQSAHMKVRDPDNPPEGLTGKSKRNWQHNARKEKQNYNYKCQYPPFHIPSMCYTVHHIHRFTELHTMDLILKHFEAADSFTIDTESVRCPANLALIQVQSIPTQLPSFVLLIQLRHLPTNDSLLFNKIQSLFKILFDQRKSIYSWGPLQKELEYATRYCLFDFPIYTTSIDLQSEFFQWYRGEPHFCNVCKPNSNTHITTGSSMFCGCRPHVDANSSHAWSLQNATLYATSCFLDKSQTKNEWFEMLDPKYARIPSDVLSNMVAYAVYDCLTVTYLRLPVTQRWSLVQLENTPIDILLTDSREIILDLDLEYISEDELTHVIQQSPSNNHQEQEQEQQQEQVPNEVSEAELIQICSSSLEKTTRRSNNGHSSKHSQRSAEARARRNKKRNIAHRLLRYRYWITRFFYHRFTMKIMKEILDQFPIDYNHVKSEGDQLIIGVKDKNLKEIFEQLLPVDIFDKKHYHRH